MRHVLLRPAAVGLLVMLTASCAVADGSYGYGYGSYGRYYPPYAYGYGSYGRYYPPYAYGYGPRWGSPYAFGPLYGGYRHHYHSHHFHPGPPRSPGPGFPGSLGFRPNR
jgi:hypothetical protein